MNDVAQVERQVGSDRGQVSVLFALLLVIILVFVAGVAVAGRVAVERARARTAADAVALAAGDPLAQQVLVHRWDELGAEVQGTADGAFATSGQAQAQSWVRSAEGSVTRSPALVAIIARAEQIIGGAPIRPLTWHSHDFVLAPDDATRFELLAADFEMCATSAANGAVAFALC